MHNIRKIQKVIQRYFFYLFFTSAPISAHLRRCETLEIDHYIGGFRRLASALNLTHE